MSDEVDPSVAPAPQNPFPRGAKPTPRYRLAAAVPFRPLLAPPLQFAIVPPQLDIWYNGTYGICVTAQEAFSKAVWSIMCGLVELFVPPAEVLRWATKYGFRDGANLDEVMDRMQKDGFTVGGVNYKDGPYNAVDYSNEDSLQAAIASGPVNIAIDADALPGGAGNRQGWFATGGGHFPRTDHCVALCGYGPAGWLYQQLGVPLPAGLPADKEGYLLFTWATIGFVDHAWLMGTCEEAWVRVPTTPGQSPVPVPPPPPPPVPPPPPPPPIPTAFPNYVGTLSLPWPFGDRPISLHPVAVAGVGSHADVWQILTDIGKLFADAGAGNLLAAYQDVLQLLRDFHVIATARGLAPVVSWLQVFRDATALVAAVWTKDWPAAIDAVLKLAADFGLSLSRAQIVAAVGHGW